MIGDYWYANNNRSLSDIVYNIKGTTSQSAGGSYTDHIAAIKYATHNLITYKRATSGFTDSFIRTKIDGNVPLTLGVRWSSGGGHMYVVRGYNLYSNSIYIELNDSLSGGIRRSAYYLDFMSGNTSLGIYNDHFYM
jgi:hypothetical protein